MESVHLQLSEELLARIDAERGMVARNRWIRWAVEQALDFGGPAGRTLRAAVAEQSQVDHYRQAAARSSVQAKRDVRPVPKAKP